MNDNNYEFIIGEEQMMSDDYDIWIDLNIILEDDSREKVGYVNINAETGVLEVYDLDKNFIEYAGK